MSSLLLRKTLNHVCVEGRGTRYATTVSRKYDADTDLDPSMEISCWAPQAFWQPTCYGGRRNSCSSYHWKRWQWRELSLAKGSRSLWRSRTALGRWRHGKPWRHQARQRAELLIRHALKRRRGLLGASRGDAQGVTHVCAHTSVHKHIPVLSLRLVFLGQGMRYQPLCSGWLWQIFIDTINKCDWGLQFKQAMRSHHKSACHVATSFTINLP